MNHALLEIAGGKYEAESQYGKLPFDLFLLEFRDYRQISKYVFNLLDRLPEEIRCQTQELNHGIQLEKLTRVYIEGGLAIRKKYVDLSRLLRRRAPHPAPQLILPPFQVSILCPIFTTQERNLMVETINNQPSRIVRTCYRDRLGDAARHQWLLDEYIKHTEKQYADSDSVAPGLGALGQAPEFLNDATRYDFGSDYETIFSLCPDLLHGGIYHDDPVSTSDRLMDFFNGYTHDAYDAVNQNLSGALTWLAGASILNWIQVEDEAFFDGEPILLVYYDECGRTCYSERMGPEAGRNTRTPALQHGGGSDWTWRDSIYTLSDEALGDAYKENGVIGSRWMRMVTGWMSRVKKETEESTPVQEAP